MLKSKNNKSYPSTNSQTTAKANKVSATTPPKANSWRQTFSIITKVIVKYSENKKEDPSSVLSCSYPASASSSLSSSVLSNPSPPIPQSHMISFTLSWEFLWPTLNLLSQWSCSSLVWNLHMVCISSLHSRKLEGTSLIKSSKNGCSSLSFHFRFMVWCLTQTNRFLNTGWSILLKTVPNTCGNNGCFSDTSSLMEEYVCPGCGFPKPKCF